VVARVALWTRLALYLLLDSPLSPTPEGVVGRAARWTLFIPVGLLFGTLASAPLNIIGVLLRSWDVPAARATVYPCSALGGLLLGVVSAIVALRVAPRATQWTRFALFIMFASLITQLFGTVSDPPYAETVHTGCAVICGCITSLVWSPRRPATKPGDPSMPRP